MPAVIPHVVPTVGAAVNLGDAATLVQAARERTAQRIAELTAVFDAIVASSDSANLDDEHDPEGATVGFERAQVSALLERARAQLVELDAASERIQLGSYGRCECCAQPIPPARLAAQPAAQTCVRCAGQVGPRRFVDREGG